MDSQKFLGNRRGVWQTSHNLAMIIGESTTELAGLMLPLEENGERGIVTQSYLR
jgi:hypothetical protein